MAYSLRKLQLRRVVKVGGGVGREGWLARAG